jgi:ubiquitin carboxyl-terminal hydrolase 48
MADVKANAFLQLWFHIIPFRNGLNSCVIKPNTKIFHLVRVLAALQYSKKKVVDPSGLVKALKLQTDDQQDAGE